jgi:hypothetical protein
MGVMLSLDRQRPARGRRRQGQHARQPGNQPWAQTLAAVRRCDSPPSGRLLTRLARTVLARRGPVVAGPEAPAAAAARDGSPRDSSAAGGSAPAA